MYPSTYEELLTLWLDNEPTARSPYKLYGCPPMWKTFDRGDGMVLFSRPGRTISQGSIGHEEIDGVHYQWQKDGVWYDQGYQTTFPDFLERLAKFAEPACEPAPGPAP